MKEKVITLAETDVQPLRKRLLAKKQMPAIVQSHLSKPDVSLLSVNNGQALERFIETLVLKAYA